MWVVCWLLCVAIAGTAGMETGVCAGRVGGAEETGATARCGGRPAPEARLRPSTRRRWAGTAKRYKARGSSYAAEIAYVTTWYHDRYNWMDQQLAASSPAQLP